MSHSTSGNDATPGSTARALPTAVRAAAFWAAVLLPFFSVAVLATGFGSILDYLLFVVLLSLNVVTLIVGHDYRQ